MQDRMCKECNEIFNDAEQVRRHLRKHGITFQVYSLKWFHNGNVPLCKCGCGKETNWNVALKSYTEYVHGHHALGRKKTDEEKQKIGKTNSENMKRFYAENPDIIKEKLKHLRAGLTPEIETNRIEATRQAYASMSEVDKEEFRNRTRDRWARGEMKEARKKASSTFRKKSSEGLYNFTERNEKLSIAISQKYVDGDFIWAKGKYLSDKTGKECCYRSSYELTYMKVLDTDPTVLDWQYEPFSLKYEFDGKTRRYIPDFIVHKETGKELIEVKPNEMRDKPMNVAKRQIAIEFCNKNNIHYVEWEPNAVLIKSFY